MAERKAVSSPAAAHDIEVYAEGVRLMKARSKANQNDPIGWEYQSRMHGKPNAGPLQPGEPKDWSQCQHGTWFFLPWHRMYLLQFERIIRTLTGEADFALPYWDYADAGELKIPPAFTKRTSPLFAQGRTLRPGTKLAKSTWPLSGTFDALGGRPSTTPEHLGEFPGSLELNPHNPVHGRVGGDMGGFQSPLDPLFWIHHCNIDRLWAAWLGLPNRANPTASSWANTKFDFPDPDRRSGRRSMRIRDVATLEKAGYTYDDLDVPGAQVIEAGVGRMLDVMAGAARNDDKLSLVEATSSGGSVEQSHRLSAPPRPEAPGVIAAGVGEPAPLPGLFLRLENVGMESGDASSMWNVFVQKGDGERYLVGTIAPFGLAGLTAAGGRQTLTFDLTPFADDLVDDEGEIEITFDAVDDDVEGKPFWERAALYTSEG